MTKPKLGSKNFLSEDLKQLMMDKDETGVDVNGDDDLPPLLQVHFFVVLVVVVMVIMLVVVVVVMVIVIKCFCIMQ